VPGYKTSPGGTSESRPSSHPTRNTNITQNHRRRPHDNTGVYRLQHRAQGQAERKEPSRICILRASSSASAGSVVAPSPCPCLAAHCRFSFGQGPRPGHTAHRLTPLTRRLQTQNTHDAGTPETPRALHFRGETCRTSRLASERHVWSVDWRHITEYRWTQSRSTWARRSVGESPCSSSGRSTRPRPCQRGGSAWQRRPCSRGHEVERAAR
jgi:hypothetical protein